MGSSALLRQLRPVDSFLVGQPLHDDAPFQVQDALQGQSETRYGTTWMTSYDLTSRKPRMCVAFPVIVYVWEHANV